MGKLALAAKITHVPSMYLSEFPGPNFGCRSAAIEGHKEIDRRCRLLDVDTIVVFDVHWQVNSEYHINCAKSFGGSYTSNELPHFIQNMPYAYAGNPELGHAIADVANEIGVRSRAHSDTTLELGYGTLVPMRYMNADSHYKVISISGWCEWHDLHESGRFGLAVRKAIEDQYDGNVAILACGSLSHRFADNGRAPEFMNRVYDGFLEQVDRRVIDLDCRAMQGLHQHASHVCGEMLGRGRHARHRHASRCPRVGPVRKPRRNPDALLRQLRHGPGQRCAPGLADILKRGAPVHR